MAGRFAGEIRERPGMAALDLSQAAVEAIEARAWPGNVRELRNAIERAAILARGGRVEAEHLAEPGSGASRAEPQQEARRTRPGWAGASSRTSGAEEIGGQAVAQTTLADAQRLAIQAALEASGGRIYGRGGAAERLAMKPSTLQSAIKRLRVERLKA